MNSYNDMRIKQLEDTVSNLTNSMQRFVDIYEKQMTDIYNEFRTVTTFLLLERAVGSKDISDENFFEAFDYLIKKLDINAEIVLRWINAFYPHYYEKYKLLLKGSGNDNSFKSERET